MESDITWITFTRSDIASNSLDLRGLIIQFITLISQLSVISNPQDDNYGRIIMCSLKYHHEFDFIECFTTTFLRTHSWLNWVDEDDDEDEVGLKEKPEDTRYIKKITSK